MHWPFKSRIFSKNVPLVLYSVFGWLKQNIETWSVDYKNYAFYQNAFSSLFAPYGFYVMSDFPRMYEIKLLRPEFFSRAHFFKFLLAVYKQ